MMNTDVVTKIVIDADELTHSTLTDLLVIDVESKKGTARFFLHANINEQGRPKMLLTAKRKGPEETEVSVTGTYKDIPLEPKANR